MRVHTAIARRRRRPHSDNLVADLLWRIRVLIDALGTEVVDLVDHDNREAFSDVLGAFVPAGFQLVFVPSGPRGCICSLEEGGKISFHGLLISEGNAVAEIERTIWLSLGRVHHHNLRVVAKYRGNRIAPRSLIGSVKLYDALAIREIHLRASFSGSWYWAQWGFHFADVDDLVRMQRHTQAIVNACGGDLDVSTFTHPEQFFRLGHPTTVSFAEMIEAMPERRDSYEEIALQNGIGPHQQIPFGRAVMLTGPSWDACLTLDAGSADRLIYDDLARRMKEDGSWS